MIEHGWLIIDKPAGITSARVVGRVKHLLKAPRALKIGHAGTLDPMATGMLILAIGEATKLIEYAQDGRKTYAFTLTFGETRDTDDAEGQVVARSDARPTQAQIEEIIPGFLGKIQQVPPVYSALKVAGQRAYALARAGETVALKAREVEIDELLVVSCEFSETEALPTTQNLQLKTISLETTCSKGTYIRSLGRDIASATGCLGYVSSLRRLSSGCFLESMMISLETFEEMVYKAQPFGVHAVDVVLDDIPAIELSPYALMKVTHGNSVSVPHLPDGRIRVKHGNRLIALCDISQGLLKPMRVFNL